MDNDAAGFADYVEVDENTTVQKLFRERSQAAARLPHPRESLARPQTRCCS